MTTVFHAWPYCRFIEVQNNLKRKKLYRTNQCSKFLGGSFSNKDNVRAPVKFGRQSQHQYLKRLFFFKNRPIHFHVNSTRVIRPIKRNELSFSTTSYPSPQGVVHQIQVQKPILVVTTDQIPDHI